MAFRDQNNYAVELALRTKLNYYTLLKVEYFENNNEITNIQNEMISRGYIEVSHCVGTQLLNSILGLLVIPEQQFFNQLNNIRWSDLNCLHQYVCGNKGRYGMFKIQ